ncbi:hypothetical protein [Veronia pacifica]|uniref:Uncharacterized protein n=1 Tax=Veronia pacifica TaxID=1080227 RepID=A0A1C3ERM2_9GAMM|nr:hypothetical protein [Veronia pacifica]ODA35902.1 hypothetical protein A8L45_02380 [Veronia pacifica]
MVLSNLLSATYAHLNPVVRDGRKEDEQSKKQQKNGSIESFQDEMTKHQDEDTCSVAADSGKLDIYV